MSKQNVEIKREDIESIFKSLLNTEKMASLLMRFKISTKEEVEDKTKVEIEWGEEEKINVWLDTKIGSSAVHNGFNHMSYSYANNDAVRNIVINELTNIAFNKSQQEKHDPYIFPKTIVRILKLADAKNSRRYYHPADRLKIGKKSSALMGKIIADAGCQEVMSGFLNTKSKELEEIIQMGYLSDMSFVYVNSLEKGSKMTPLTQSIATDIFILGKGVGKYYTHHADNKKIMLKKLAELDLSGYESFLDQLQQAAYSEDTYLDLDHMALVDNLLKPYKLGGSEVKNNGLVAEKSKNQQLFIFSGTFRKNFFLEKAKECGHTSDGLAMMRLLPPYIIGAINKFIHQEDGDINKAISLLPGQSVHDGFNNLCAYFPNGYTKTNDNKFLLMSTKEDVLERAQGIIDAFEKNYDGVYQYLTSDLASYKNNNKLRNKKFLDTTENLISLIEKMDMKKEISAHADEGEQEKVDSRAKMKM